MRSRRRYSTTRVCSARTKETTSIALKKNRKGHRADVKLWKYTKKKIFRRKHHDGTPRNLKPKLSTGQQLEGMSERSSAKRLKLRIEAIDGKVLRIWRRWNTTARWPIPEHQREEIHKQKSRSAIPSRQRAERQTKQMKHPSPQRKQNTRDRPIHSSKG